MHSIATSGVVKYCLVGCAGGQPVPPRMFVKYDYDMKHPGVLINKEFYVCSTGFIGFLTHQQ